MTKFFEGLSSFLLSLLLFLLPIFVLSLFPNPFITAKGAILVYGLIGIILVKAAQIISSGRLEWQIGKFDTPVLIIFFAVLFSAVLQTPNKMDAFLFPGTATFFLGAITLYFLINQEKNKSLIKIAISLSALLVSIISLLAISGVLSKVPQLPELVRNTNFTTLGSHLNTLLFLLASLPIAFGLLLQTEKFERKLFWVMSLGIVIFGIIISVTKIWPGSLETPLLLDFKTSWSVAIDTLKQSPFLGSGPGNYISSFNLFRPISYNQTDNWNIKFLAGRDLYSTLITETGLLGLTGIIFLFVVFYRRFKLSSDKGRFGPLLLILGLLAIFPPTFGLIILLFVYLSLAEEGKALNLNLTTQDKTHSGLPSFVIALPLIFLSLAILWQSSRLYLAEANFQKATSAFAKSQGEETYKNGIEAIRINPSVDRYHSFMAQVYILFAQNLVQNKAEGEEITDQDRESITQFIERAIAEAKATAALNQQKSANWEVLAGVYRAIMSFAQGADSLVVQAYSQAVALDPLNPTLRINLGGVHYTQGNYDEAIDAFKLSVAAKPDYANAHYNLAVAYREKGEIERAIAEMKLVLSLVKEGTNDYRLAQSELEALEAKKPSLEAKPNTDNLTLPEAKSEPALDPLIELPEEATAETPVNQ